jgi:hypothetical protein
VGFRLRKTEAYGAGACASACMCAHVMRARLRRWHALVPNVYLAWVAMSLKCMSAAGMTSAIKVTSGAWINLIYALVFTSMLLLAAQVAPLAGSLRRLRAHVVSVPSRPRHPDLLSRQCLAAVWRHLCRRPARARRDIPQPLQCAATHGADVGSGASRGAWHGAWSFISAQRALNPPSTHCRVFRDQSHARTHARGPRAVGPS